MESQEDIALGGRKRSWLSSRRCFRDGCTGGFLRTRRCPEHQLLPSQARVGSMVPSACEYSRSTIEAWRFHQGQVRPAAVLCLTSKPFGLDTRTDIEGKRIAHAWQCLPCLHTTAVFLWCLLCLQAPTFDYKSKPSSGAIL